MTTEKAKLSDQKVISDYGTNFYLQDNNAEENSTSSKVIFCVHGKLSGCCTVIKGGIRKEGIINHQGKDAQYENHCHREREELFDKKSRNKLIIASILCVTFMILEIIGGIWSNSLAISTDAAHLFTDFTSFMISLFSIWMSNRPATKKMPFGWYRAEVIGALTSVLLIWVVTGVLLFLAVKRILDEDFQINISIMLATSAIGIIVNLVMGLTLHQHSHNGQFHGHSHDTQKIDQYCSETCGNVKLDSSHPTTPSHDSQSFSKNESINVRAAFIHVVGDFIQSAGVFIAALIIFFKPSWSIADPICTFFFSILVILTTVAIIKDVMNVLMEGTPNGFEYTLVENIFMEIEGVIKVHNLRIWALSLEKTALSAHLVIVPGTSPQIILRTATRNIHDKYNFLEMTLQIEEFDQKMDNCKQCKPLLQ